MKFYQLIDFCRTHDKSTLIQNSRYCNKKDMGICAHCSSHIFRLLALPYPSKRATRKPHAKCIHNTIYLIRNRQVCISINTYKGHSLLLCFNEQYLVRIPIYQTQSVKYKPSPQCNIFTDSPPTEIVFVRTEQRQGIIMNYQSLIINILS